MTARKVGRALALLLAYTGLTVLFTYPLFWFLGSHYVGEEGGDARVYLWNLWWVEQALTERFTNPFHTDVIFYPIGIGLSLHTLGFLQGLLYIPFHAALGDVVAVNIVLTTTFVVSALSMYALARYTGAAPLAAFLVGLAFAFCPYRLSRLAGHYDLLGTEWLPLYTLAFLKAMDDERSQPACILGAGILAALCGYTTLTYLAFLVLLSALYVGWWLARTPARSWDVLSRGAAIALTAGALLLPLFARLYQDITTWSYPSYPGAVRYGADLAAFFLPGAKQTFLGATLGGMFDPNLTESVVFAGYFFLLLTVLGVLRRRIRRSMSFWILVAATFFVLSLGSRLKMGGWESGIPLPFAVLDEMPLFDQLRAPSRLSIVFMMAAGLVGAATWTHWLRGTRHGLLRVGSTVAASAIVVAEYLAIPIPVFTAGADPWYQRLGNEENQRTVVEIPGIEQVPGRLMYHQTIHGKPILIGTAARVPLEKTAYYFGLPFIRPLIDLRKGKIDLSEELLSREKRLAPRVARFLDLGYIVVDRAYERRGVSDFIQGVLPVEAWVQAPRHVVWRVRHEKLPEPAAVIDPAAPESRLYFESGWSRPESEGDLRFRWANAPRSHLLLRRPTTAVTSVFLEIAPLPGAPQRLTAELDGVFLSRRMLDPDWQEIRLSLPSPPHSRVERLSLRWSSLRRASERDPRRLAARVREIRFQ